MSRILVIDDNEALRQLVRNMLELARYEVLEAGDGGAGLDLFRSEAPDLVITDMIMPNQEGIETIRYLRQLSPDVPIIAISGGGHMEADNVLDLARKFGARRVLCKPFRRKELLAAVAECLNEPAA